MFSNSLPKTFKRILKNNTRKQFNENFKIVKFEENYWALCDKDGHEIIPCPVNKKCSINEDCGLCWERAIKNSTFKGESRK